MTVFQFGLRVAAPRGESAGWVEPGARRSAAEEPLVAPVLGTCADAVVESGPAARRALVYFDREAASLPAAVVTSVLDLEHSGLDCLAVVPDDDLVTPAVIAPRLGLPPAAVGALLDGPVPATECGGHRVFRWSDVVAWLRSGPAPGTRPAPNPAVKPAWNPAVKPATEPAVEPATKSSPGPGPESAGGPAASASGAPAGGPVFAALNLALRLRRLVRADPTLVTAVRDLLAS